MKIEIGHLFCLLFTIGFVIGLMGTIDIEPMQIVGTILMFGIGPLMIAACSVICPFVKT